MSLETAEFVSAWANWIFLGTLIIGVVMTYLLIVSSGVKEAALRRELALAGQRASEANDRAAQSELALEKERTARVEMARGMLKELRPRGVTKEQFDAIVAELKGKIDVVLTVVTISEAEASSFGYTVLQILQSAGVKTNWIRWPQPHVPGGIEGISTVGLTVYEFPNEQVGEKLMYAFTKGGISVAVATPIEASPKAPGSPLLVVGLKQPPFTWLPSHLFPDGPKPPWEQ